MRFRIFFFLQLVLAASTIAKDARNTAYEKLQRDALATALLPQIDKDVKANRLEDALKKSDQALSIRPDDPMLLNAKGAALLELKRFDEAAKVLDRAAAADPKAFAPAFNQFEVLFLQKKYDDAALALIDLQSRFGAQPLTKYHAYLCYALGGQPQKATEALAAMRYPQDGAAWYFTYAADRLLHGKKADAKKLIATAESIAPEDSATYRDTLHDLDLLK